MEFTFEVYSASEGAKVELTLCGGDAATQVGNVVMTDALPADTWTSVTIGVADFFEGLEMDPDQQINGMKVMVPPLNAGTKRPSRHLHHHERKAPHRVPNGNPAGKKTPTTAQRAPRNC